MAPKGKYMMPDIRGDWMPGTRQDTAEFLTEHRRFMRCGATGEGLSAIDRELLRIRREQAVDYANALAGYKRGHYADVNGKSVLVTNGPKLLEPRQGRWPIIGQIVKNLLADSSYDQASYFHGWLAETCKSLKSGKWRPGQVLGLIGRSSNGKSLLQSIITVITGGREADPSPYLARRTNFNGELFAAEHLRINDEIVVQGTLALRQLGNGLKQIAANRTHKLHDKFNRGIDLPVFWRCTMSLNDAPEDLALIPEMKDGMADKFILLKCSPARLPMPTNTTEQETELWEAIVREVPSYLYWLLHKFALPGELRSSRYGVKHFHHPAIITVLRGRSPEEQLMRLVDSIGAILFADGTRLWTGTATELRALLLQAPLFVEQEATLPFVKSRNFTDYLDRLAARFPSRVQKASNARSGTSWVISPGI
jgi:hypothetical protein